MKLNILTILFLLLGSVVCVFGQSTDKNYIHSWDVQISATVRQLAITEGNMILRFDHNHPVQETSNESSKGDRSVRDDVLKNNINASVNIHFKQKNKWFSRSIKNDTKHHYSGEFN